MKKLIFILFVLPLFLYGQNEVQRPAKAGLTKSGNYIYTEDDSVGIGTTTPTEKLEVDGNIKGDSLDVDGFIGNLSIGSNYISNDGDNEGLSVDSGGDITISNNLTITDSLGIGTTSPKEILHVDGNIMIKDTIFGLRNEGSSNTRRGTNGFGANLFVVDVSYGDLTSNPEYQPPNTVTISGSSSNPDQVMTISAVVWMAGFGTRLDFTSSAPSTDYDTVINTTATSYDTLYLSSVMLSNYFFSASNLQFNNSLGSVSIGVSAKSPATSSTYIGNGAGTSSTGTNSTFIGTNSGKESTGNGCTWVGNIAGQNDSTVQSVGVGERAGNNNKGAQTTFLGWSAGWYNEGDYNIGIGASASESNTGKLTTSIGLNSTYENTGDTVIGIGYEALQENTGSHVVAIGYNQGYQNTTDNILLIGDASLSATPLIYGDFANDTVKINGTFEVTGDVTYNLRHLHAFFADSAVVIDITQNTYTTITNATDALWTDDEANEVTFAGDTITVSTAGDYVLHFALDADGSGTNDIYKFKAYKNGVAVAGGPSAKGTFIHVSWVWYFEDLAVGDDIAIKVTNTVDNDDLTVTNGVIYFRKEHD
jgi:hypothetical protein